jgi:hypothetical protein
MVMVEMGPGRDDTTGLFDTLGNLINTHCY